MSGNDSKIGIHDLLIPEIFLEVEIADLNLEKGKEVSAFFGAGNNFEAFVMDNDGEIKDWKEIETMKNGRVYQTIPKKEKEQKCRFAPSTIDPKTCDKRYPHCYLYCRNVESGCIKIQANRKYIAESYDDGKRSFNRETPAPNKTGKWPDGVKIGQFTQSSPTEEILTQIRYYKQDRAKNFEEEKKREISPTFNTIMVLHKGSEIDCVVDRYVSF